MPLFPEYQWLHCTRVRSSHRVGHLSGTEVSPRVFTFRIWKREWAVLSWEITLNMIFWSEQEECSAGCCCCMCNHMFFCLVKIWYSYFLTQGPDSCIHGWYVFDYHFLLNPLTQISIVVGFCKTQIVGSSWLFLTLFLDLVFGINR